ncbi:hypothetical protein Tco_0792932 [Tanacetum coccineum]
MSGPSDHVEDNFPVEEVTPVKAKKVSKRHQKAKTTDNLEASKPWITAEKVVEEELDIQEAVRKEAADLKREEVTLQLETLELL